jgi:hypothetical protein
MVLLGLALGLAVFLVFSINPFLSVSRPVSAEVLVVESWLPDYALFSAVKEFRRGGYKYVIATGCTLADEGPLSRFKTGAEFAATKLAELGLQTNVIVAVPSEAVGRDRTYTSGVAVKDWLAVNDNSVKAVDVYSLGAHARRSRLLFQKALGSKVKVGIIACPDQYYNPKQWWATSEGVRTVTSEGLAYIYARFIFPLLPHNNGKPTGPTGRLSRDRIPAGSSPSSQCSQADRERGRGRIFLVACEQFGYCGETQLGGARKRMRKRTSIPSATLSRD